MKVAHHGSKNSTHEELRQIIRPEMSLISCGKDNSYGHPGKELLERLELVNSDYRITYQSGAITIKTDGTKMWISDKGVSDKETR